MFVGVALAGSGIRVDQKMKQAHNRVKLGASEPMRSRDLLAA